MTATTDPTKFVRALVLPEVDPSLRLLALPALTLETSGKKAGYVDAGSLVSFVAGLSGQNQADVLNSTLLAQLAANKKFDREADTKNWYQYYRTVLENVGWVLQEFDFTEVTASGDTFTADKVILDVLGAIATGAEAAVVTETMNALKALSDDDGRMVLFSHNAHSLHKGSFQVAVATLSGGVVVMRIGAVYFSSTQSVTRVLWFGFSKSNSSMYKGGQTIDLNEDVYSRVREQIIQKLGDRAQTFVANLDI